MAVADHLVQAVVQARVQAAQVQAAARAPTETAQVPAAKASLAAHQALAIRAARRTRHQQVQAHLQLPPQALVKAAERTMMWGM